MDPAESSIPAEHPEHVYRVALPMFEGPLDLLLHLIQEHELDILNIPIGFITEKYLEYIRLMDVLAIDLASEYLVMAATLAHMKSKMLLPVVPSDQQDDGLFANEEDPRAELVRRLLEYQKYKQAAAQLGERTTLGRDVFQRGMQEAEPEGPTPFSPPGVFSLLDAFQAVLKRSKIKVDHEVVFERMTITDRILQLTDSVRVRKRVLFEDLFDFSAPVHKFDVVVTFLALLEMCRLRMLRLYQSDPGAALHLEWAMAEDAELPDLGPDVDTQGVPAPLN